MKSPGRDHIEKAVASLLGEWEKIADQARLEDKCVFKITPTSGLASSLAKQKFRTQYFFIVDMPPDWDCYRLDIPMSAC